MPCAALPCGDQVEHVATAGGRASLSAGVAHERHLQLGENGEAGDGILDLEKAGVEIDVRCQRRDADEGGDTDE